MISFLTSLFNLLNKIADFFKEKQDAENSPDAKAAADEQKVDNAIVNGNTGVINDAFNDLHKNGN